MKLRNYAGPLGILAAGVFGLSLLWGISVIAAQDLERPVRATTESLSVMDLAVSNMSTAIAMTKDAASEFVPTFTPIAMDIVPTTLTSTSLSSNVQVFAASSTPVP